MLVEDISSEKRVRSTMSRYMDPQLANQLLEEGDGQAMLGGQAAEATVLFTDIRSFTTIAESLGPQATVSMLNEYFEIMVACISDAGGMLDKFIGDALMAGFGVPLPSDDAPDAAVKSAISMISQLRDWNAGRLAADKPAINMASVEWKSLSNNDFVATPLFVLTFIILSKSTPEPDGVGFGLPPQNAFTVIQNVA